MDKKVLITGAYGFLGRYTARALSENGYAVTGLGHGKWQEHEYKHWGISKWLESTVTFESLMNLNDKFDLIVHCGGGASVAFSYQNPYEDFQKSVQSTLAIAEYVRLQSPGCKIIYPSSPAVQGSIGDIPINEDIPSNPISPYGYHKKMAEEICYAYSKIFSLNINIIRFFSVYGAGLRKQLLWDACMKIKNADKEISFFGTGNETRDWIHVTDAANLIVKVAENTNKFDIINGGTGIRTTISDVLHLLRDCYEKNLSVTFNQIVKEGDPQFYQADISKATELGWSSNVKLAEGINEYVKFFKSLGQ